MGRVGPEGGTRTIKHAEPAGVMGGSGQVGGSIRVKVRRVGRDEIGRRYVDLSIKDHRGHKFREILSLAEVATDLSALTKAAVEAGVVVLTQKS